MPLLLILWLIPFLIYWMVIDWKEIIKESNRKNQIPMNERFRVKRILLGLDETVEKDSNKKNDQQDRNFFEKKKITKKHLKVVK